MIYGDTDSLFVLSGATGIAVEDLAALGRALAARSTRSSPTTCTRPTACSSRMELEFEAIYRRFFLPPMRTPTDDVDDEDAESRGRAKGYAGLRRRAGADGAGDRSAWRSSGMEAVRHDWTPLAQELQRELLRPRLPRRGAAEQIGELVRTLLRELRAGRMDGKLAYRKSLRKPVEAYTKSSPPHARAAALLPPEERSGLIRYVWTIEGPQPESRRTARPRLRALRAEAGPADRGVDCSVHRAADGQHLFCGRTAGLVLGIPKPQKTSSPDGPSSSLELLNPTGHSSLCRLIR